MAPSQAAQNLREWAEQMAEAGNWYLPAYGPKSPYSILSEKLGIPDDEALLQLNDFSLSNFASNGPEALDLDNLILWLCFLAAVIETDGTDWIQNA